MKPPKYRPSILSATVTLIKVGEEFKLDKKSQIGTGAILIKKRIFNQRRGLIQTDSPTIFARAIIFDCSKFDGWVTGFTIEGIAEPCLITNQS